MTAGDGKQVAVAVERERIDRVGERLDDYLIGLREPLAVGKRRSIVNHRDVKSQHRSKSAQRHRDMARADDYQALCTDYRIDEQSHAAVRFEMRPRLHPARSVNFEQSWNRVGGPLDNLRESRRWQIDWSRIARGRVARIDERPRPGRYFYSRTRIDHRQQRAGSAASGSVGQFPRDIQVARRGPKIDEHVHYSAAGSDLALVKIAGEIDFCKPRAALVIFF